MKADQLKKDVGKLFRIRPLPLHGHFTGQLDPRDDKWSLDGVARQQIKITNLSTGHSIELGLDNVREFRSPDFLILHCQLTLKGNAVNIEPLLRPKALLNDEQERLLEILAECQTKLGVPKLRISRNGVHLSRPEKGLWIQVEGVNIGLELFGPHKPEAHRLREFEPVIDSMPGDYLRRIPDTAYGNPFTVAVTPEGFNYLGLQPPAS
jgi:hypothetical protein